MMMMMSSFWARRKERKEGEVASHHRRPADATSFGLKMKEGGKEVGTWEPPLHDILDTVTSLGILKSVSVSYVTMCLTLTVSQYPPSLYTICPVVIELGREDSLQTTSQLYATSALPSRTPKHFVKIPPLTKEYQGLGTPRTFHSTREKTWP